MTTVEEFLRPPHGPEEFGHVLVSIFEDIHINHDSDNILQSGQNHSADNTSENSQNHDTTNSHYSPLAEFIHHWTEFDVHRISLDPLITNCLSMPCEVRWEPQVPTFSRVIYSERQLEALYLQTLITRVNIALDKAIPSTEDRIAIVIGPGAFENVSPEATAKTLIPDWIVVQGKFDIGLDADALPILKDLAAKRKILAVGDTKLVRQRDRKPKVLYTNACHRDFLRQVQDYCPQLESSPRKPNQRGLRSNGAQQLIPGLGSQGSDVPAPTDRDDDLRSRDDDPPRTPGNDDPYLPDQLPPFATPAPVPSKRLYSTSPEASPIAAGQRRYQGGHRHSNSDASNSGSHQTPSDPASSSQGHSGYAPSDRDVDVGAIHIRSFDMMGWEEDNFDMMDWGEEKRESPYRALFMFVMWVRAFKQSGNTLEI
ncbi:hypothetical protein N5P37_004871 [Trichoderma harzianum]|nr:hypothetical protein N5P37_004871 [Trichoderma harzianum]